MYYNRRSNPLLETVEINVMKMRSDISKQHRKSIAAGLSKLLADSYSLYLKTQNFHWNVTGPMFTSLHVLFEQQYTELATAVDEIAERIRALGEHAPGSYSEFAKLSDLPEETAKGIKAEDMLLRLVTGQEHVVRTARNLVGPATKANDEATLDILTRRIEAHEKNAWMLRSHLE